MNDRDGAFRIAMSMYADEPCRICGRTIFPDDLSDLVFAGYSQRNDARAAHGDCWRRYPSTEEDGPHPMWVYQ